MYNEELLIRAQNCSDKKERAELLGKFYTVNIGLIVNLMNEYCKKDSLKEDFLQVAYIAVEETCKSYKCDSGYSMLAYYRTWVKHESYKLWLLNGGKEPFMSESAETGNLYNAEYKKSYEASKTVERKFMRELLWERVDALLTEREAGILRQRFVKEQTLVCIGDEYDISVERVRQLISRSCKNLHNDVEVQAVGRYFHYYQ